jgi:hypothetical protein
MQRDVHKNDLVIRRQIVPTPTVRAQGKECPRIVTFASSVMEIEGTCMVRCCGHLLWVTLGKGRKESSR